MTTEEIAKLAEQFKFIKPQGARVALRKLADPEQTKSGLYIPKQSVRPSIAAMVVAVGELEAPGVKVAVGDVVLLPFSGSGSEIVFEETTLLIVSKHEILAVATPLDREEIQKSKVLDLSGVSAPKKIVTVSH